MLNWKPEHIHYICAQNFITGEIQIKNIEKDIDKACGLCEPYERCFSFRSLFWKTSRSAEGDTGRKRKKFQHAGGSLSLFANYSIQHKIARAKITFKETDRRGTWKITSEVAPIAYSSISADRNEYHPATFFSLTQSFDFQEIYFWYSWWSSNYILIFPAHK